MAGLVPAISIRIASALIIEIAGTGPAMTLKLFWNSSRARQRNLHTGIATFSIHWEIGQAFCCSNEHARFGKWRNAA
jgi:hypothetical protein